MNSNGLEGKYGTFRFPVIEDGKGNQDYVISGPTGLQVSTRSPKQDTAVAFIAYIVSVEAQARLLSETQRIPTNTAAVEGLELDPALAEVITDLGKASGTTLWLDSGLKAASRTPTRM